MFNVFIGFMAAWVIFGVLALLSDKFDWYFDDWYLWLSALPILLPVVIIAIICQFLYRPWRNVIKPVEQKHFEEVMAISKGKQYKITNHFYLCIDGGAKSIFNKIFFVRIKKETDNNEPEK